MAESKSSERDRCAWFRRGESGFVIVWMALVMTVLLGFAGMAVDLGNWYFNIQRAQRAADAASLDGDPYLPQYYKTNNPAGLNGRQVAYRTLLANGVPKAKADAALASEDCKKPACIAQVKNQPTQLQVKVQTTVANTFFRMFGLGKQESFSRLSIADYTPELHITSESNLLGGPEIDDGSGKWGPPTSIGNNAYWLQLGGRATSKAEGDRLNSEKCTPNTFSDFPPDRCTGGKNDEYTTGEGYLYLIDVKPSGTGTKYLEVQAYDPEFTMSYSTVCPTTSNGVAAATCPADEQYDGTSTSDFMDTGFAYYPNDSFSASSTPERTCPVFHPRAGAVDPTWETICKGTDHERIPIDMSQGAHIYLRAYSQGNKIGTNHYMLRAGLFSSATGGAVLNPLSYKNVQISADQNMAIYNEIDGLGSGGHNSTFIIGEIHSEWAGRTIHFEFWDVGDAFHVAVPTDGWLFLEGNGSKVGPALANNCVYTKPTAAGNENSFSLASYKNCGFAVDLGQFNGKLVKLNWTVPSTYRCDEPEVCTLKVSMDMNGDVADDTTTTVREPGKPLHIIK